MFFHPNTLWLLAIPISLIIWQIRIAPTHARSKAITNAVMRFIVLSLMIIALARPFNQSSDTNLHYVAVIDCSASIDSESLSTATNKLKELADKVGQESLKLVVFDSKAREFSLKDGLPTAADLLKLRSQKPGSAVSEALALSVALCPQDGQGVVHLFSDGRETKGDIFASAADIGRRGIDLVTHEIGARAPSQALLTKLVAPSAVAAGESIELKVKVEATKSLNSGIKITDEKGAIITERNISLKAGINNLNFQVRPKKPGIVRYDVSLLNTERKLSASIKVDRTVIGVLESAPDSPATAVLTALVGSQAEVNSLNLSELSDLSLKNIDTLVMADLPISKLPKPSQLLIRKWVENGGGLLVTGGRNAFGPGGYTKSSLASILPVRFPQKKEARDPSSALAIIIDTSGSMGQGGVSLAQEVARFALKRLKPHDKAGIVEFSGNKRWAAPIQSAANSIAIQRSLNRLSSGGGTMMYPAIGEAYYGLLNVRARTKHIIILTDGGVETGTFETLIRRIAADNIQVSTVLIGPRAGSSFLTKLASWGRGQFYSAPSRFQIPEIIIKQPSASLLDPFVQNESSLEAVLTSQLTNDISLKDAPKLDGYVKTEMKKSSELILRSSQGDPILARWHYGLGRVATLTTALGGKWSEKLMNWPSASTLIANLTRQLTGISAKKSVLLNINQSNAGIGVDIRTITQDSKLAAASLQVTLKDKSGEIVSEQTIFPVQPHTWKSHFDPPPTGDYTIQIADASSKKLLSEGAVFISAPNEFNKIIPNSDKLDKLTQIAREFSSSAKAPSRPLLTHELWHIFATIALILFILMILVRRLPNRVAATASNT